MHLLEAFHYRSGKLETVDPFLAKVAAGSERRAETALDFALTRTLRSGVFFDHPLGPAQFGAQDRPRALRASRVKHMQEEVDREPVKLGSLLGMKRAADPELLARLLRSLAEDALPVYGDQRGGRRWLS